MERLFDQRSIIGDHKKGVAPIIPICRATFWDRVRVGVYPPGFKFGSRHYWSEADVEKMIDVMKSGSGS